MVRKHPNIVITGTPGVGKTSHCESLARETGLKHMSINQVVKDRGCYEGMDVKRGCYIVDEDKVKIVNKQGGCHAEDLKLLDSIESEVSNGGFLIDWHSCDAFPEAWIDLVVILRTNTAQLYDRLKARDYAEAKLQENIDSEIMQVVLLEARDSYDPRIIIELQSDDVQDLDANVERIEEWIEAWNRNTGQTNQDEIKPAPAAIS